MRYILKFLLIALSTACLSTANTESPEPRKLQVQIDTPSTISKTEKPKSKQSRKLLSAIPPGGFQPGMGMGLGYGMMAMNLGMGMGMGAGSMMPGAGMMGGMAGMSGIGGFGAMGGGGMGAPGMNYNSNTLGNISTESLNPEHLTQEDREQYESANGMLSNPQLDINFSIPGVGHWQNNRHQLNVECEEVKREAAEIAGIITRRQNKLIFQEVMKYILKTKYLLGLAEINMTKALREKVIKIMDQYSDISDDEFNAIAPRGNAHKTKGAANSASGPLDTMLDTHQVVVEEEEKSMTEDGPEIEDLFEKL